MVRSVGRSRGCGRCLKRKIKCDELHPTCSPCGRISKPCPGAYTGIFLVHASQEKSELQGRIKDRSIVQERLILPAEPPYRPLFEDTITTIFVASLSASSSSEQASPQSWTQYLSSWISSSTATWSIRAATLVFYGQETKQEALCKEADRCYARALQGQQRCISRYTGKSNGSGNVPLEVPTEQDVLASLMLMYYELLNPTVIGSWVTHLRGTAELLALRGPQNCQDGPSHLMFRSLRLLMAQASIRAQLSPDFATPEWRTVPFIRSKRTAVDSLLDIVYQLSPLLNQNNSEESTQSQDELVSRLQAFANDVAASEQLYAQEMMDTYSTRKPAWHCFPFCFEGDEDEPWLQGGDFCSTMPSAMYNAVWIIIYHLMRTNNRGNEAMTTESIARCSSLLDFIDGLFKRNLYRRLNAGSCVQLVFPLEVVSWYSPCGYQRQRARVFLGQMGWVEQASLEVWGRQGPDTIGPVLFS
ncbi:hypothetical protein ACJZ2D_002175 [Fusarium nematophilum]